MNSEAWVGVTAAAAAGVKAGDQARAPVVVAAKVAEKAAVIGSNRCNGNYLCRRLRLWSWSGLRRGFRGGYDPGRGRGRGYGRGYGSYPPAAGPAYSRDVAGEMNMLKADADYMKTSLDAINKRIEELEKKPAESF